ncbi:DUF4192 domain-containing protein [Nocardioides pocheonensis]|uniref:DUF4192 domain-containing protein n=1 Tax=Nocardioides pocheonensis TaxID=661485 RepID=A0A3N0GI56_9ACTN|nr:DUF4192 domain-containing protein [Nocardioides pocheonensis]RNM12117.1 DUF4192 domain-containing protein [Nocardioides pocheonensis]
MTLSVENPDELIAVIPHLLGFKPEESIVFLPMRSDLPVARVDLPTTTRDRDFVWRSISDAFSRYAQPGTSVGIVCITADRAIAEEVGPEFAARLDTIGIDTRLVVWADETRWADLTTGDMGLQTDAARERIAAMTVLGGRPPPAASRNSLATTLVGDREPVARLLPETREAARENTAKLEGRWALGRMQRFQRDGVRLSDGDAARLLVSIESIPTRDRLWLDMNRGNAASHVALWTDMTQRAPDGVRSAPASLLGFAGWLSGHGALAWCALDQVPKDKPYTLANLVAAAVQTGMHPREWEAANRPTERGLENAAEFIARRSTAQAGPARPAHGF